MLILVKNKIVIVNLMEVYYGIKVCYIILVMEFINIYIVVNIVICIVNLVDIGIILVCCVVCDMYNVVGFWYFCYMVKKI